jgi:hypothetical protein
MINEYETHDTLNPILWDGDELHRKLRIGLMKIAKEFYNFLEVDTDLLDVILIGSSANYNWTEFSDIDLHVIINFADVSDNFHLVDSYMRSKKSIWNDHYPLTYKALPIELYAQDLNDVFNSTVGVYSIMRGTWINKPNPDIVSVDDSAIQQKAEPYIYEIEKLNADTPNLDKKIKNILLRLKRMRQSGLDANGEYALENMAFKYIRNKGYIEKLKTLQHEAMVSGLQIESVQDTMKIGTDKIKKFISAMHNETKETKMAFAMMMQHLNGQKKLNDSEWSWVRNQMKDVMKMLGLTTLAVAPGGSLALGLMKVLKADKYMLPSSFKTHDHVVEALESHCNKKKTLSDTEWNAIINHTSAVTDPMGQWKHPGKCTMIPSGNITMKDVPYEVFGIDDTGHYEMMQPEQTYTFPGKQVFEIPNTAQWKTLLIQLQNKLQNGMG